MGTRVPARFDFNRSAVLAFVLIVAVLVVGGLAVFVAAVR
jgi:hypothetical protein